MNLSSRTAAGRSRSADGDLFSLQNVGHTTDCEPSTPSGPSPHGWKRALQERIWSGYGPKGLAARSVLALLLWHADANGRVWLGIQAIANKTGAGSLRTVRNALDSLVRQGWLRSTSQTWASLTAEQTAAGRPVPRRGDVGQAPNLYLLLDGCGKAASNHEPPQAPQASHPGLVRVSLELQTMPSPGHNDQGGPSQKSRGGPLADLHRDLDPKGSRSRIERAERSKRISKNTHRVSKNHQNTSKWLQSWKLIIKTHAEKTRAVYGLPPLPPDVKREQQQALAECLEGAAAEVVSKWHYRTGATRDVHDVQRDLATRVMQLYFKRDNEHLRRVKHALRDLPREFHARITEAMQAMLRESHDLQKPRQTQLEEKVVKTINPEEPSTISLVETAQVNTAHEARRLLDALGDAVLRDKLAMEHEPHYVQDKPSRGSEVILRRGIRHYDLVVPRPRVLSTP